VSEVVSPGSDYSVVESEPAGQLARNLRVMSHLWASATAFFFIAFLFAYFYLRALDEHKLWKPKGVSAPTGWGVVIMLCIVASAGLLWWGAADQRADRRPLWRLKGVVALALTLLAVIFQIVAWASLGFGPTDGGYASVYLGWTGLYALFALCSCYWLETTLAVSFRYRKHAMTAVPVEPGHASGDAGRTTPDIEDPVTLNTSELAALVSYWLVLAGIGVITWVVLYLL
jgi:heme/copper-type cytochrome/quinol oxidase subunit 3